MVSTDYDTPRRPPTSDTEDDIAMSRVTARHARTSVDLGDGLDRFEADGSVIDIETIDDGLTVLVLPIQAGEFICTGCRLIRHSSQRSSHTQVCLDCAC